ncbi:UDP-N-acetylenolpyruvoylglucosamine reductase [candidate division WOR-1 bacterium RIFCSPHIGHO2_01_FULL_53_15]|uniref:UDP-N-acetylenolpyruvoylglucosamine reductase n=1 Tax=candidate division WOR-1 bacterium RIFCSPHIGHO2_01_FULL_53_15 TaxID=1802564 RepID=A0A1F4PZV7_UNCSA|nr:MAG: UDP-N-acetylenolpyruvoylglucosamine reductase [candidate division WOR-1 bacterium RIFCSPHIGHO2_01_FULL_53_15]OGC10802.1 MAG: UDP-N-acetylenolpyruvoylglucosamine reductase [candidate division WOR-1 bacterium RIFCSPHIGHO2_02_FULL_53_26]
MKMVRNEPLKKHTSFRIGGPAEYFCAPTNIDELREALKFARENRLPVAILGMGTNLLALDNGFRGLVIKLGGGLNKVTVRGRVIHAGAGTLLPVLLNIAARRGLAGLEFLAGIPGTVGGAAAMNAGAWDGEIGRYVDRVRALDKNGDLKEIKKPGLRFGYRRSVLQKGKLIAAEVVLKLRKGSPGRIRKKILGFLEKRKLNQPLGSPNAGSIFKNPKGKFAGKLLEEAGFKGARVGDAQVSVKHANFILNLGEAKARDVIKLMTRMRGAVKRKFKVTLEPELKIMVQSIS